MYKCKFFLLFFCLAFAWIARAQTPKVAPVILDSVYLKSGVLYEGVVSQHIKGQYLRMEKKDGKEVIIGDIDIARVIDNNQNAIVQPDVFQVEDKLKKDSDKEGPTNFNYKEVIIDVVYLKDGSVLKGKIQEYKQGEYLVIQLTSGSKLTVEEEEIERIRQQLPGEELPVGSSAQSKKEKRKQRRSTYSFKEKGWYNVTYLASYNGRVDGEFEMGLGIQNTFGYQFNRLFGFGVGVSLDAQSLDGSETLYPVYAEFRGYFTKTVKSPYYSLSTGYSFAFKNKNQNIAEAEGGYLIHPAIGYRLGADAETNVLIDIGYRFQSATYIRQVPFDDKLVKQIDYRRFSFRLGLIF